MGRIVGPDEPTWLPEDRDVLAVWAEFQRSRHDCGRWVWEDEDIEGMVLDYDVCPFCAEVGKFSEQLRDQREDMYGVFFGYWPTEREER